MTRTFHRKRQHYTTFKKLPPGARFHFNPSGNGPFTKFSATRYEDSRAGDDVAQTWLNAPVRRLWKVGIESN
jgi:hypothetical protein